MGGGALVGSPVVTPTKVTWQSTTGVFELFGNGFSASASGISGLATRVSYSENGSVRASIDGLNLSAAEAVRIAQSSNPIDGVTKFLFGGDNIFKLSGANDMVHVGTGRDVVYGGGGVDTVIIAHGGGGKYKSQYEIKKQADGSFTVSNNTDHVTLYDVERVMFSDGIVALDTSGIAGQAYRIYQAAFDRTPDAGGLKYWIDQMDGGKGLASVAAGFITSNEFQSAYGNLSNSALVGQFYKNILGREAEKAGLDFWVGQLDSGKMDRATVLANISESPENVSLVAPAIDSGIWLG